MVADTGLKERLDLPDYSGFFRIELPELEFEWFDKLESILKRQESQMDDEFADQFNGLPDRVEFAIEDGARTIKAGKILYRARIHKDRKRKERFTPNEMARRLKIKLRQDGQTKKTNLFFI